MDRKNIQYDRSGQIALVVMNRTDKLNAIDRDLWRELEDVLLEANQDDEIRVIILKGAGKCFSIGHDVTAPEPRSIYEDREWAHEMVRRWLRIWQMPKPLIAQVHGHCIGTASCIVCFCDLVVVSEDARISLPKLPFGGGIIETLWGFFIGWRKVREMALTVGGSMTGHEAVKWQWANAVFPAEELEAETLKLASRVTKMPPDLAHLQKAALNKAMELAGFKSALEYGTEIDIIAHATPGVTEVRKMVAEQGIKNALKWFSGD